MNKKNQYLTTSLSLAAALEATSLSKIEEIIFTDHTHRASFVFDKSKDPNFELLISQFWAKKLFIDASSYFDLLRTIKSRLFEEGRK